MVTLLRGSLITLLGLGAVANQAYSAQPADASKRKGRPIAVLIDEARKAEGPKRNKILGELHSTTPETDEEVTSLAEAVASREKGLSGAAASALENVSTSAAHLKGRYLTLLDHRSEQVQVAAIRACGRLRSTEAVPKVRKLLEGRPRHKFSKTKLGGRKYDLGGADQEVIAYVQAAAETLVALEDFDSVDEILSRDEVMAMGGFGSCLVAKYGARALKKALPLARQKDLLRSNGARGVISCMRDEKAIPDLVGLLKDTEFATAAVLPLSQMTVSDETNRKLVEDALAPELTNINEHVRGPAYDGLIHLNPKAYLPKAMEALKRDRAIRLYILSALIKYPVQDAVPYLEEFIKEDGNKNPNWTDDRRAAAQAIFKITGRRVSYVGVEKDRLRYSDPYDAKKFW